MEGGGKLLWLFDSSPCIQFVQLAELLSRRRSDISFLRYAPPPTFQRARNNPLSGRQISSKVQPAPNVFPTSYHIRTPESHNVPF
jgi:hypothetical protein